MIKKYKKLIMVVISISIVFNLFMLQAFASHFGVSVSNNGNGTLTVTVSGNVVGGFQISVAGQSQNIAIRNIGGSASATFNTGAGSHTVTVTGISLSDANYNVYEGEVETRTVTVTTPTSGSNSENTNNNNSQGNKPSDTTPSDNKTEEKKNSDSSLASLSVSNGKLSPSFSAGTISYKVSLPSTASSIKISASARDSKASVSGVGTRELEPGNNKLSVVCSAEDGSTTTYTINVYVDEKPLTYVTYNGTKLGVSAQNEKGGKLSKAFDETKIKINGIEVPAWKNKALNITLVYLQSEGIEGYYMYDEAKQEIVSVYEPMAVLGQNIVRVDVPENLQKREGMKFTKIKVDGKEFPGWTFEDKSLENYALIYVMNDAGKYEYYQYEKTQNTLQLYSGSAPLSQESYLKYKEDVEKQLDNSKTWNVILGVLAGLFAVGMISSIVFAFKKKNTSLKYEKVNIPARKISKASNIEADNLINKSRGEE